MADQLLPHDEDAEEAVLGSVLLGAWQPNLAEQDDYVRSLLPQHFYKERNGWIFAAMRKLQKQGVPVDQITLAHMLEEKLNQIGGPSYLSYLISRVPTPLHIVYYAKIVKDMAERRETITQAGEMAAGAFNGSTWNKPKKPMRPKGIPLGG